jgi:glycosyltransferase involved in cell wall biosynthesis
MTYTEVYPFVSVVIPVRNEAGFIADLISSIQGQDYPADRIEIIVADGMSTDGTREELGSMQADDPRLLIIDNPGLIVSSGLNAAIERSRGDIIIRIDGHALIAEDFVRQNVALLNEHPEAWSVGGPIRHVATTPFGKAVALAMSHPLGVGNAFHRYPTYEGYVEGSQFPAIRRWVFSRIGFFDERLVRNQDDEFNYRIRRSGGLIYVSPRVRYSYFVRCLAGQLFRQYLQYGFWRIPLIEKYGRPTTWRQMVPTLFLAACVFCGFVGILAHQALIGTALPILYGAALLIVAIQIAAQNSPSTAVRVPIAIATMHVGYGIGMAYGLWSRVFNSSAWNTQGPMSVITR